MVPKSWLLGTMDHILLRKIEPFFGGWVERLADPPPGGRRVWPDLKKQRAPDGGNVGEFPAKMSGWFWEGCPRKDI